MFKKMNVVCLFFLVSLIINSCVKSTDPSKDPKKTLTDYISMSFSIKSLEDKSRLLVFLTGDAKQRLQDWNSDQFKESLIDSKRTFLKLYIREVKYISTNEVEITYELTFTDQGKISNKKERLSKVTNKKLCQLVLKEGKWLIEDVRNLKELVEYQNEMTLP